MGSATTLIPYSAYERLQGELAANEAAENDSDNVAEISRYPLSA